MKEDVDSCKNICQISILVVDCVMCPGIPVLTDRTKFDKWMRYPLERERLLGMLSRRPNTIIISGDSHFAEMQCHNTTQGPLFEVSW